MTDELDLLSRYMDSAPQPVRADLEEVRQRLDAVIHGEMTAPSIDTAGAMNRRHRVSTIGRLVSLTAAAAVVVLLVVAVVVPRSDRRSGTSGRGATTAHPVRVSRTWSLAGYISLPGWQVSSGGQSLSTSQQFTTQLNCPTAETCYSAGTNDPSTHENSQGVITVTRDGGATWQQSLAPANGTYFFGFTCPTTSTCMVAGEMPNTRRPPSLFTTTDGGRRWTSLPIPGGNQPVVLLSCATTSACVVLDLDLGQQSRTQTSGASYVTSDGGHHWAASVVPKGFLPSGQSALQCFPGGRCIATGTETSGRAGNQPAAMIYSTDGGLNWRAGSVPSLPAVAGMMSCVDAEDCVSIEQKDLHNGEQTASGVLVTSDGGESWSKYRAHALDPTNEGKTALNFASISCSTTSDCWASGLLYESLCEGSCSYAASQGVIMATVDGGRTWTHEQLPTPPSPSLQYVSVYPMTCATETACFAVGTLGLTDQAANEGVPSSLQQDVVLTNDGGPLRTRSNTTG